MLTTRRIGDDSTETYGQPISTTLWPFCISPNFLESHLALLEVQAETDGVTSC
jgi:hypothetical protein